MADKIDSKEGGSPQAQPELDVTIPDPTPVIRELRDAVNALDQRLSSFFRYVIIALGIGFLTLFFMVVGILIEAWRFNSAQYTAYLREEIGKEVNTSDIMNSQKALLDSVKKLEQEVRELRDLRANQIENQPTRN